MAKRYNPNRVRLHRSYTSSELALALCVHKRTVQAWHKRGLAHLPDSMPYLFMGSTVREFIKKENSSRKVSLMPDEMYCLGCHRAVKAAIDGVSLRYGGKMGKVARQVIVSGLCPFCGAKLKRFTTTAKLKDLPFASCVVEGGHKDYLG